MQEYTHKKGEGEGKYNGMARAGDWEGKRVVARRTIRNGAGKTVRHGMRGVVTSAHRGLHVTFDVCHHCGTVMHVTGLNYFDVRLSQDED